MRLRRLSDLSFQVRIAVLVAAAAFTVTALYADAEGEQQIAKLGNCKLQSGGAITGCQLGYRTWGKLNAEGSNAVLFPTWFTGTSADIAGQVGADKLIDPAKYFLIVVDSLGDGVSSSPSNSKTQPRMNFPVFNIYDMVSAEYRLVTETLHLKHLHAVMGISMGGIQTFEWMADYPDFMDLAIPIVGSPRLTSYDMLIWHLLIDIIRSSPAWQGGNYEKNPAIPEATMFFTTCLTTPGYYARTVTRGGFPAQYAEYQTAGAKGFDRNNSLYQLGALLQLDIARGGTLEDAAKRIHAKALIIPSQQDHAVNPGPALEFAKLLGAKTLLLTSDCGHLAPGCEADKLNPTVREFLAIP